MPPSQLGIDVPAALDQLALETAKIVGRDTDQQMFAPEWHRLRGIAFWSRGQPDDAHAAFEDALEPRDTLAARGETLPYLKLLPLLLRRPAAHGERGLLAVG